MRAAVCVGDAHVRGRGAVFTSWHARGPGVGGGGGDSICGLTAKQRVRVARACVWPRRRFGLRSSDSDSGLQSSVVRQRQGGAVPGASSWPSSHCRAAPISLGLTLNWQRSSQHAFYTITRLTVAVFLHFYQP